MLNRKVKLSYYILSLLLPSLACDRAVSFVTDCCIQAFIKVSLYIHNESSRDPNIGSIRTLLTCQLTALQNLFTPLQASKYKHPPLSLSNPTSSPKFPPPPPLLPPPTTTVTEPRPKSPLNIPFRDLLQSHASHEKPSTSTRCKITRRRYTTYPKSI